MNQEKRVKAGVLGNFLRLFHFATSATLKVRNYQVGDGVQLAGLWNRAYESCAGYVRRSAEQWGWGILERPGISNEDIIIVEQESRIAGYGVLGRSGMVLELAIDPKLSRWARGQAVVQLTEKLEERCRERGDEGISFLVPTVDKDVSRVLTRMGYRPEVTECLNMAIVNLPELLRKILELRSSGIPSGWSPSFLIHIEPGYYRFMSCRCIYIQIGVPITVTADSEVEADYTIKTDLSTLTDLIFGRVAIKSALTGGSISVEPPSGVSDFVTVISLVALDAPWYTPHADGR